MLKHWSDERWPWATIAADGSEGCAMCCADLDEHRYHHPRPEQDWGHQGEQTPFCSRECFLVWEARSTPKEDSNV